MERDPCPSTTPSGADCGKGPASPIFSDDWDGLSRDVIERFVDVAACSRENSRTAQRGYRADLCAIESWMKATTGHTLMTATTAELWVYFRKAIAVGTELRLLDRLLISMQHFYAYIREAGYRDDDPALSMPRWVHRYFMPPMSMKSGHALRAGAHE